MKKLLQEIKNSPFKLPKTKYYFGKLKHGTPYFYPRGFCSTIFKFRKLKLNSQEEIDRQCEGRPWLREKSKFKNLPMVRRSKDWIVNIFGSYYWIQFGSPIKFYCGRLGWKDRYHSPRYEWAPSFHIFFFGLQFCKWLIASDTYWEMFLWWRNYCDKDIEKAEKTWKWVNFETKISTWDKKYLK